MNKVILSGRLTRDPDIRYSTGSNQMAIAKFNLAVDRDYKKEGEPNADFISCTAFGKTAEVIEKYVKQGTKIIVCGRWQTGNYTNRDSQKVYTNDCLVEKVEFCEKKSENGSLGSARPAPSAQGDGFMNLPEGIEEELPFS